MQACLIHARCTKRKQAGVFSRSAKCQHGLDLQSFRSDETAAVTCQASKRDHSIESVYDHESVSAVCSDQQSSSISAVCPGVTM